MSYESLNTLLEVNDSNTDNFFLVLGDVPSAHLLDVMKVIPESDKRFFEATSAKNLLLSLKNVTLPDVGVEEMKISLMNVDVSDYENKIVYSQLNTTFQLDEHYTNYLMILMWLLLKKHPEKFADMPQREEKNTLRVAGAIIIMDNHRQKVAEFAFTDLHPTNLPSIDLNYQATEKIEFSVTWGFSYFLPQNKFSIKYI